MNQTQSIFLNLTPVEKISHTIFYALMFWALIVFDVYFSKAHANTVFIVKHSLGENYRNSVCFVGEANNANKKKWQNFSTFRRKLDLNIYKIYS